jgi:hypothetical protein
MKAWVFLCNDSPLEHWMEGYMERFDAWEETADKPSPETDAQRDMVRAWKS